MFIAKTFLLYMESPWIQGYKFVVMETRMSEAVWYHCYDFPKIKLYQFSGVSIIIYQGWLKPQKKKVFLRVLEAGSPLIKMLTGAVSSEAFVIGLWLVTMPSVLTAISFPYGHPWCLSEQVLNPSSSKDTLHIWLGTTLTSPSELNRLIKPSF